MKIGECFQAVKDFWRVNQYGLDEYVIRDGKKHKFALICPGGGYNMVCSFIEGMPYAKRLNKIGYSAFVLYYRCKNKARYPAPLEDLARALQDILSKADELNIETDGYSLWGSSAGGHLASLFCTDYFITEKYNLPKPASLILSYPVITMKDFTHQGSRKNLIGKNPTIEMIQKTSVEEHISPNYSPTFIWYGDSDKTVDNKNSEIMKQELNKNSVKNKVIKYNGIGHGVGLAKGTAAESWFEEAVNFWKRNMK